MKEITTCEFCGSTQYRLIFTGHDRLLGIPGIFSWYECIQCGLLFLSPQPDEEEIQQYYPDEYIPFQTAIQDERSWLRRTDRRYGLYKRCRAIQQLTSKPGRILDVGCATGIFLDGMQQRGWEPNGVEPSSFAAEYARRRFGLDVHLGYLEDAHFPDQYFDVITFWDVIEHVPSPMLILQEVERILKPGGWLVLSMPNPGAWDRGWFNEYWAGWDIPRHFHLFSTQVLQRYLERQNLRLERFRNFTGTYGTYLIDLQLWLPNTSLPPAVQAGILAIYRSIPFRALAQPYYFLVQHQNKSPTMVAFARKNG